MTSALEVSGLTFRAGSAVVLDQVDLTVPSGTIVAITGRARVGKSALLGTIVGHVAPTSGHVLVFGRAVREHVRAIRQQTTWVARSGALESHLTVRQNLHLILRLGRHPVPCSAVVDKALRESDVPDRMFDQAAGILCGRESLAVWIAAARLRETPLVLLDDPTFLLNPVESARAVVLIRELCETGTTVLVATPDRRFADEVADTVHVLESSRLSDGRSTTNKGLRGVGKFVTSLG